MNSLEIAQDHLESAKLSIDNSEIKELLDEIIFALDLLVEGTQHQIKN